MSDGFPVTITDDYGGEILVGFGLGAVYVRTSDDGVLLDAGQLERLAQAIVAASWETGRVAVTP